MKSAWPWLHCGCSRCQSISFSAVAPESSTCSALESSTSRGPRIPPSAGMDQKTMRELEALACCGLRCHLPASVATKEEAIYLLGPPRSESFSSTIFPPLLLGVGQPCGLVSSCSGLMSSSNLQGPCDCSLTLPPH